MVWNQWKKQSLTDVYVWYPEAAEKLIAMNYDNLAVKETTIVG